MIAWARLLDLFKFSENKVRIALTVLVGLITGVAAWGFIRLIEWIQFWPAIPGQTKFFLWPINRFLIVTIPAAGGLLCGLVLRYGDASVKGTGTADFTYALRRKGGHIPGRFTFFKTLASLLSICSGGAVGPEAPGVAIGAGVGSLMAEFRGMEPLDRLNLVVSGAAAGFAAVFNAPIAGVLFAIEVLLKEFASQAFVMVILSTVTASVTTRLLLGNHVFIQVPATFAFLHIWELGYYAILGVLTAIVSKAFVQIYFAVERSFDQMKRIPVAAKPMIGGLILGLLSLYIPAIMGSGHSDIPHLIESELLSPWTWTFLLLLLVGKMVACPLTLCSGGSGGLYVPILFMGALMGGLLGRIVHVWSPTAAPVGAYMLVGMGAVFAGITYAPFTGILLLFEMTQDYNIILPLMFTVGITMLLARALDPESLDQHKLLKKGLRLHETIELRALEKYHVGELMNRDVATIPQTLPLAKITEFIGRHPHTGYPVVDAEGNLVGLMTYSELHQVFNVEELPEDGIIARDIMRAQVATVFPEDSAVDAVHKMQIHQVDRIVAIDPVTRKIVGILTKSDILGIYRKLLK